MTDDPPRTRSGSPPRTRSGSLPRTGSGVLLRVHKRDRAVEHREDCEGIVEHIKAMRGHDITRDWGRPVCEIPNVFVTKWLNEEGVNLLKLSGDELRKFIARKVLTDPDFRDLRYDYRVR
jgi:hypothetical protein